MATVVTTTEPQETPPGGQTRQVRIGVIAPVGLEGYEIEGLVSDLSEMLAERYPEVEWDVALVSDPLLSEPAGLSELVDATRARLLDESWDLAVLLTDLPLRLRRRPMLSHVSPTHGVALVSLPAHGALRVERRLRDSVLDALGALIGDLPGDPAERGRIAPRRTKRRLLELATDIDDIAAEGIAFPARVVSGNIRLLLGMIRANRPWRLIARLTRAAVSALAFATVALIASDAWLIAARLDNLRLATLMVLALGVAVASLIVAHGLWEPARGRAAREQVTLFNLATLATVVIGVLSLYAEAFVLILIGSVLLIDSSLLADTVHHRVDLGDYLRLTWLTTTLATVGGALGAALESDEAVREAAYGYRSTRQPHDEGSTR